MKAYKGSRDIAPLILNLGTRWRLSAQLHALVLLPMGRNPSTHGIGGWVGPRDSLEVLKREKFLAHAGIQKLDHPVHCLVITPDMLPWLFIS
jgi:hypothetical protein